VAAAQVDPVQVSLEDAPLAVLGLDGERDHGLPDLPKEAPLVGQEDVLDELLGERAPALGDLAPPEVGQRGAGDAGGGDAGVPVEGGVLGGEHGLDHVLREVRHPHGPLLPGIPLVPGGEHGGFQGRVLDRLAVQAEAGDPVAVQADEEDLPGRRPLGRHPAAEADGDAVLSHPIAA
jgi:hypothetical protein